MSVYLCVKFEVSSIIPTGFRWGNFTTPPPPPQNEPLKSPTKLGLTQQIHILHEKNPLRKGVKRLLVCVPFRGLFSHSSQIPKTEGSPKIING